MGPKKTFYFFRHGETDWNLVHRCQGHTDIPLNKTGIKQAKSLIPRLQNSGIQVIYSSDLSRAWETGKTLANELSIEMHREEKLRECHFGLAEGLDHEEIFSKFGKDIWDKFREPGNEHLDLGYPEGETRRQCIERVEEVITELCKTEHQVIGISTHGGIVRNYLHYLMPERKTPLEIPNCVIYRADYLMDSKIWKVLGPI
ncbi:MAG: histidine phosphatase family protein [Halobacteriovoraceae bacterium]|jgi:broad specificity phosphatase PhoE|nr:histidine phosphatase family protein [Halobacteriovoraceae bacterium]